MVRNKNYFSKNRQFKEWSELQISESKGKFAFFPVSSLKVNICHITGKSTVLTYACSTDSQSAKEDKPISCRPSRSSIFSLKSSYLRSKAFEKRREKEKKVSAVSTLHSINQGSIKPLSSYEPYVCQSAKQWSCVITRRRRNLDRAALRKLTSTNGLRAWTRSSYRSELDVRTAEKHLSLLLTCSRAAAGDRVSVSKSHSPSRLIPIAQDNTRTAHNQCVLTEWIIKWINMEIISTEFCLFHHLHWLPLLTLLFDTS